jgi:hypothetical protein
LGKYAQGAKASTTTQTLHKLLMAWFVYKSEEGMIDQGILTEGEETQYKLDTNV